MTSSKKIMDGNTTCSRKTSNFRWTASSMARRSACGGAKIYDEQPCTWKQSWTQRLRWSKGFTRFWENYAKGLVKGFATERRFACYDMFITIAPAIFVSLASILVNACFLCKRYVGKQLLHPASGLLHNDLGHFFHRCSTSILCCLL